jgi:hypothetical protein
VLTWTSNDSDESGAGVSVNKPKVVLTRFKSPTVDGEPGERVKRKRRGLEVPRWLAVAPAMAFGALGLFLIGAGVFLRLGLMVYYNLTAGDLVRFGEDRGLWGPLVLNRENFLQMLWALANGVAALGVCSSWLRSESRRALKMTVVMVGFLFLSSGVLQWSHGTFGASRWGGHAPPPAAARPPGAPGLPAGPAGGNAGGPAQVEASQSPVVTIWLDRMTDEERTKNEQVLKREFPSLRNYVPDTVRIEGDTLVWRATIPVQNMEAHKLEAIAILRRNNIRLSDFSERWLKGRASGQIPGPPIQLPR